MKKILLLGDSIRMGYCGFVRELLSGKCEVLYPAENGRFLQYTLRQLQDWKAELAPEGDIDVVHWNNGLWDVGHLGVGKTGEAEAATAGKKANGFEYEEDSLTPLPVYEYMLGRVHRRIRTLFPAAKVVFACTTPALEDQCPEALRRSNAEIRAYNEAARRLLAPEGVLFNDLYAFSAERLNGFHSDWVHYNDEGSRQLAEQVVRFLDGV